MLRQSSITHLIDLVQDEIEEVESRNERRWEINVSRNGQFGIVSRVDRVGSCQDRRPGVEGGDDPGLGNRDGLLLLPIVSIFTCRRRDRMGTCHDFVQDRSGGIRHLVKFIDTADTTIRENEGTTVWSAKNPLVFADVDAPL